MGPLVAALGAISAGVGVFLPWLRSGVGPIGIPGGAVPGEFRGFDLSLGSVAVAAAAAAFLAALLWMAIVRALPLVAIVLVVAGGLIVGVCAYTFLTAEDRFVDVAAAEAGNRETTTEELVDLLPRFFEANDASIRPAVGFYLASGGGILVLLGGIAAMAASRRRASRSPGRERPPRA